VQWKDLLFLHWGVEPAQLQPFIPPGAQIDTFRDQAYLGLIALTMHKLRPRFSPPLPWIRSFPQVNLRTYVRDEHGDRAVFFLRLETDQPLAAWLARRWFGLPYHRSKFKPERAGSDLTRLSAAAQGVTQVGRFAWQPRGPEFGAAPGSLEHFLTERYRLIVFRGRLRTAEIHHPPFALRQADVYGWDSGPLLRTGIPLPSGPPTSALTAAATLVGIFSLTR
jgi:uncharacterized protein YqjF (DUF2071 family)